MGDQTSATTTPDDAQCETRYTEAEALEAGDSFDSNQTRNGATTSTFAMRQLRLRDGLCADTICVPRSRDERVGGQTTRCRSSSRSRRSATESASPDRQCLVVGQVCYRCHRKTSGTTDGATDCCNRHCQPSTAKFPGGISSDQSYGCRESPTPIKCAERQGCSEAICDHAIARPVDSVVQVPLPRGCPKRDQEYTYAYDTNRYIVDTCGRSRSPQAKTSCAVPPNAPLGLDGSSEETKSDRPRAVERLRTRREKPPSQVASRIRELELKNAMPAPRHFRPAGHTRHDHDIGNHRSQVHRDERPDIDLIFPLHVRRFPRRTSDGTPIRPETPLHRSIPDEEPYIHAPQPAQSMPMLKDPPEHDSHPSPKPELLDTSRGNQDGFAVASGYGRRASRNFAVRRNSRP